MDVELTIEELEALLAVAGEKLMESFENTDGAAYMFWLNVVCKVTVLKSTKAVAR